jgi:hypothetical protein
MAAEPTAGSQLSLPIFLSLLVILLPLLLLLLVYKATA